MPLAGKMVLLGAITGVLLCGEADAQVTTSVLKTIHSTRFDDWTFRCADVNAANGRMIQQCEVAQIAQVKQGDGTVSVLTLAIATTGPDMAGQSSSADLLLTALVPLNVVLSAGIELAADGKELVTVHYRNCNEAVCWAQQKFDRKILTGLQKASVGEARMLLMNGQAINLSFSLKGLTKALAALQN